MKEEFSIGELFKKIIKKEISKIHTSIPAVIENVNDNNTVDVLPLVKDMNENGEYETLPIITNVPVRFIRTSKAIISIPLEKGDEGVLLFAERCIKNWQLQGGVQEPEDRRRFHLTDCYFSPDLMKDDSGYPLSDDLQIILNDASVKIKQDGEIVIENKNESVTLKSNGNIELGGSAVEKAVLGTTLQTLVNAFITVFNGHTHPSVGSPPTQQGVLLNGSELSNIITLK